MSTYMKFVIKDYRVKVSLYEHGSNEHLEKLETFNFRKSSEVNSCLKMIKSHRIILSENAPYIIYDEKRNVHEVYKDQEKVITTLFDLLGGS